MSIVGARHHARSIVHAWASDPQKGKLFSVILRDNGHRLPEEAAEANLHLHTGDSPVASLHTALALIDSDKTGEFAQRIADLDSMDSFRLTDFRNNTPFGKGEAITRLTR